MNMVFYGCFLLPLLIWKHYENNVVFSRVFFVFSQKICTAVHNMPHMFSYPNRTQRPESAAWLIKVFFVNIMLIQKGKSDQTFRGS